MNRILLAPALVLVMLIGIGAGPLTAQTRRPVGRPMTLSVTKTDEAYERRMAAFAAAWATINDFYFDNTFSGLDWQKIGLEYRPRVAAAKTDVEFHHILSEMIGRLGKSHLSIIAPEYFEEIKRAKAKAKTFEREHAGTDAEPADSGADELANAAEPATGRYGIGVELKMLGDKFVVTNIDDSSGAQLAGLKAGYIIDKINGVALSDLTASARVHGYADADIKYLLPIQIVESFLNGGPETKVVISCFDENDKPRELTVRRMRLSGQTVLISQNLPEMYFHYESRPIGADIGYIKFNMFSAGVVGKFCDSLTQFKDKRAIILDLRGNIGGILGTLMGLGGMLTNRDLLLGDFVTRHGTEKLFVQPKAKHFDGRLVVLVDGQSMSAAEMFAAGLAGNHRAVVVGERTAGKSLPAYWTKLQTGAVLMYPFANLISPKVGALEGKGLQPDVTVPLDRSALLKGVDTQLEKGVAILADDTAFGERLKEGPAAPPVTMSMTATELLPPPPKARPTGTPSPTPGPSQPGPLKMIADFTAKIGGADAVKRITGYEIHGSSIAKTGESVGDFYAAKLGPEKMTRVYQSPGLGEVREVWSGHDYLLQSDVGMEQKTKVPYSVSDVDILSPFLRATDLNYLRGLKDEGEYEVDGRKRKILSATSPEGLYVGLTFDEQTGMLTSFSLPSVLYTMSDYRKVGDVLIPFKMELDRNGLIVQFTQITLNPKLEPSTFELQPKCFDKAN